MKIQQKQIGVVFIFLLYLVVMLSYENYNLKSEFYNIMLVSNEKSPDSEGLTNIVWNDLYEIERNDEIGKSYKAINVSYLQANDSNDFEGKISSFIDKEQMFVIVGEEYNSVLMKLINSNLDKKFILIENSLNVEDNKNVYKININRTSLYNNIFEYFNKENVNNDKLKIGYFIEGNDSLKTLFEQLNVESYPIDISKQNYDLQVKRLYNNGVNYYINLDFKNNSDIIRSLLTLQKENLYNVYEKENKESLIVNEDSQNVDLDTNLEVDDKTNQSELDTYEPINFISLFYQSEKIGEFDNLLDENKKSENIIVNTIDINYNNVITQIILDENTNENYLLDTDNNGIVINKID